MKVENKVMPNEKQMEEFLEEGNDEPIFMVNLLKFKEKAEYPDKRETDLPLKILPFVFHLASLCFQLSFF